MDKAALRTKLKQERMQLPPEVVVEKSRAITERLVREVVWADVAAVHCFTSMRTLCEVDTVAVFRYIWQKQPHIVTYTSRNVDGEWTHGQLKLDGSFEPHPHELPLFDVIIVPMLGFDGRLHRIGYGGGFYDKFLATQPQALKIGLCFELGRVDKLPVEPHDIAMDWIVTERHTHQVLENL